MGTPHDSLFYLALNHPEHAGPWLRRVLPAPFVARARWHTLRPAPEKIAGRTIRLRHTDLVFLVDLEPWGRTALIVIEHKSYRDSGLREQLLGYIVHLAQFTNRRKSRLASLVLPCVFRHGRRPWQLRRRIHPHVKELGFAAATAVLPSQPHFEPFYEDLAILDENAIRGAELTPLVTIASLCLQFLPAYDKEQALAAIDRWGDLLRAVDADDGPPAGPYALDQVSWYFLQVTKIPADQLHEAFEKNLGRKEMTIMSTAETIRRESEARGLAMGEARGRALSHIAILTRHLQKRFGPLPDHVAKRLETAALVDLDRWIDRVLDAQDLDGVFAADTD